MAPWHQRELKPVRASAGRRQTNPPPRPAPTPDPEIEFKFYFEKRHQSSFKRN